MNKHNLPIAPDDFETLLNGVFLELDPDDSRNKLLFEAVSAHVMQGSAPSLSPMQKLIQMITQRYSLNALLILTGIAGIILTTFLLPRRTPHQIAGSFAGEQKTVQTPASESAPDRLELNQQEPVKAFTAPTHAIESLLVIDKSLRTSDTAAPSELPSFPDPQPSIIPVLHIPVMEDTAGVFPHLTDKQIKENNKNKRKMVDMLYRMNKKKYPQLAPTTWTVNGANIAIPAFRMQNSEVINLEYRTFLFDLLIQGRKADFLKAKPSQQLWVTETGLEGMKKLQDDYFSSSFYDSYPVVNISRQGAEMYCAWLDEEGRKAGAEKVNPLVHVRLPDDVEWMYAAGGGYQESAYPWSGFMVHDPRLSKLHPTTMNLRGYFLANFCLKKFTGKRDSICVGNTKIHKDAYTTAGMMTGTAMYTAPVYSYNPNDFGIYCMSGNVAEMVVLHGSTTPGTKGGGWNSDEKHIAINGEDEYAGKTGPSPYIGFRVVLTAR
ncbi:MAG: formylglycine-generating enzyme family protein [Bacteroidia bacterium]